MKKIISIISALVILSMNSSFCYAMESDNQELSSLANSLGANKDYIGVANYMHDNEHQFNNDCYVDFLHHCSVLEAAYSPASTFSSSMSSGACIGISILEVLAHNGVIKPTDIQEGVESLSEITLNENSDRYITDYQAIQGYTVFDSYEKYLITSMTYEEMIDRLLEVSENCMNNNKYFLITFRNQKMSHAVCGIGIMDGQWEFDDTNYDKCVLVLDSNLRDNEGNAKGFNEKSCIYINSETKQCCIPVYDISNEKDQFLAFAVIDDDTILNYKGFINPSEKTNTDLSKLKHFISDTGNNIKIFSVLNEGTKTLLPEAVFGDSSGQHLFFESDMVHVEVQDRRKSFDLRYINSDRWIDLICFGEEQKHNCDIDFSDNELKIKNNNAEAMRAAFQIRMNNGSFGFEPVFWWVINSTIVDKLTVEICDEGMLFKSNGRIDATICPYYYTLDENGNFLSVTMSVDRENKPHYFYSDNNVLVKADKDHNISFYIDDDNNDVYDKLVQKGDINCDGHLDAIDASKVLAIYAELATKDNVMVNYSLGDFNNNGFVDAVDASQILAEYAKASVTKEEK